MRKEGIFRSETFSNLTLATSYLFGNEGCNGRLFSAANTTKGGLDKDTRITRSFIVSLFESRKMHWFVFFVLFLVSLYTNIGFKMDNDNTG